MNNDVYFKELENINNAMSKFTEKIPEDIRNINIDLSIHSFHNFIELVNGIPDDVKEKRFFIKVQSLGRIDLKYEDIMWLVDDFREGSTEDPMNDFLQNVDKNIKLHCYLESIILSEKMGLREKVVLILAHIEPLIFDTLNHPKQPKTKIKEIVKHIAVHNNSGFSVQSFGKLFVLGIVYVVFADTDKYSTKIDGRMPFRNNILHNGIVLYTDSDIEVLYDLLISFLSILVQVNIRINNIDNTGKI